MSPNQEQREDIEVISSLVSAPQEHAMDAYRNLKSSFLDGIDSIGDEYMKNHPADERRGTGTTYTPFPLVEKMVSMVSDFKPDTIIDCGCGSGRFSVACALAFPYAHVIAVDNSKEACEMCAANVRKLHLEERVQVICDDFLRFSPDEGRGRTLWIGNPPYVRHHRLAPATKEWLKKTCQNLHVKANGLAGLHVYFLVHIAELWHEGDRGILITSAEWLDVGYGSVARELLTGFLSINSLEVLDKTNQVFENTDTTAAIFSFGGQGEDVDVEICGTRQTIQRAELKSMQRWTALISEYAPKDGLVPLGSIASVHRGTVTGNNKFWVRRPEELEDVPESLHVPCISHAREISIGNLGCFDAKNLSHLIILPANFDALSNDERDAAERIIAAAIERGIPDGYVASHRTPWWAIHPASPPDIFMTYMARHPPVFVKNEQGLTMLNVIHGIYLKTRLSDKGLDNLVHYLNTSVDNTGGRTYCGGLTKFEPREAEAILVPPVSVLEGM